MTEKLAEKVSIVWLNTLPKSVLVEWIDDDGGIESATFMGPNFEQRAKDYAAITYPYLDTEQWVDFSHGGK